jgi:hypothetical protein
MVVTVARRGDLKLLEVATDCDISVESVRHLVTSATNASTASPLNP